MKKPMLDTDAYINFGLTVIISILVGIKFDIISGIMVFLSIVLHQRLK